MRKLVSLLMMLFITASFAIFANENQKSEIANDKYKEIVSVFGKQTSSERDPLRMCFPTSMINAGLRCSMKFPDIKNSKYSLLEDVYDEYIYSDEMSFWIKNKAPSYVSKYVSWGVEPRELWEVEVAAFNSFMGYDACKLDIDISIWEVLSVIDNNGAVVISGVFCGLNHCVCVIGYESDENDPLTVKNIIFNDPFGDPLSGYSKPGVGGDIVKMSFKDFWNCTIRATNGRHVGIVFEPSSKSKEYIDNVNLMQLDIEEIDFVGSLKGLTNTINDEVKRAASIQLDSSNYVKPDFVSIDSSKNVGTTPNSWYSIYLDFSEKYKTQFSEVISYTDYLALASYWEDKIPKSFLFPIINESLKQNIPVSQIYAISKIETLNFRYFKSLKTNSNGTIDYGIMGLNSANFDVNTWNGRKFLNDYFYYDNEYETFDPDNQLHMLKVCVKYLKYLIEYTGDFQNAAMCYNGGITKWLNGNSPDQAIEYSNSAVYISENVGDYIPKFVCPLKAISIYINTSDKCDKNIQIINRFTVRPSINYSCSALSLFCEDTAKLQVYNPIAFIQSHLCVIDNKRKKIDLASLEVDENGGDFIGTISKSGNYIVL